MGIKHLLNWKLLKKSHTHTPYKRSELHQTKTSPIINTQDTPYIELPLESHIENAQPMPTLMERVTSPIMNRVFGYETPTRLNTATRVQTNGYFSPIVKKTVWK